MMVWPLSALTQAAAALELTRVTSLVTPPPATRVTCHGIESASQLCGTRVTCLTSLLVTKSADIS